MTYNDNIFREAIENVLTKHAEEMCATIATTFRTNTGQAACKIEESIQKNAACMNQAKELSTSMIKEVRKRMDGVVLTAASQDRKEASLNDLTAVGKSFLEKMTIATRNVKDAEKSLAEAKKTTNKQTQQLITQLQEMRVQVAVREKKVEEREKVVAQEEVRISKFVNKTNLRTFDADRKNRHSCEWLIRQQQVILKSVSKFCTCPRFCSIHTPEKQFLERKKQTDERKKQTDGSSTSATKGELVNAMWVPPSLDEMLTIPQLSGICCQVPSRDLIGSEDHHYHAYKRYCNCGPKRSASCPPIANGAPELLKSSELFPPPSLPPVEPTHAGGGSHLDQQHLEFSIDVPFMNCNDGEEEQEEEQINKSTTNKKQRLTFGKKKKSVLLKMRLADGARQPILGKRKRIRDERVSRTVYESSHS